MMIVMGTLPNAAGGQYINTEQGHNDLSKERLVKNRVMQIVVIDNEHPGSKEACSDAAK